MFHSFSVLSPPCGPSFPQNAASEAMARCESMPWKCLPTAKPRVMKAHLRELGEIVGEFGRRWSADPR